MTLNKTNTLTTKECNLFLQLVPNNSVAIHCALLQSTTLQCGRPVKMWTAEQMFECEKSGEILLRLNTLMDRLGS